MKRMRKGLRFILLAAGLLSALLPSKGTAQFSSPSPRDAARLRAAALSPAPAAAAVVAAAAAPAGKPRKIEVLLIADGFDTNLGPAFRASSEAMRALFQGAFPATAKSTVTVVDVGISRPLTLSELQGGLNQISSSAAVEEDRAVVCVYHAHGTQIGSSAAVGRDISTDPNYFFGHAMGLTQENNRLVPRYNIWQTLKKKNAGLTVLLSDSCFERARSSGRSAALPRFAALPQDFGKQWRHLLEDFSGDVNITSSSVGELSWYLDRGLFTESLIGFAESSTATLDWNQFYAEVRDDTNRYYTSERPGWISGARDALTRQRLQAQATQIPLAFSGPSVTPRGAAAPPVGGPPPQPPAPVTVDKQTKAALDKLNKSVDAIKKSVEKLETDVGASRTDLGALRTDVGALRTDVDTLRTDVDALKKKP